MILNVLQKMKILVFTTATLFLILHPLSAEWVLTPRLHVKHGQNDPGIPSEAIVKLLRLNIALSQFSISALEKRFGKPKRADGWIAKAPLGFVFPSRSPGKGQGNPFEGAVHLQEQYVFDVSDQVQLYHLRWSTDGKSWTSRVTFAAAWSSDQSGSDGTVSNSEAYKWEFEHATALLETLVAPLDNESEQNKSEMATPRQSSD